MKKIIYLKTCFILIITAIIIFSCNKNELPGYEPLKKPELSKVTDLQNTSYSLKWVRVYRAKSYLLDISTQENFSSFIPGYNSKITSTLNEAVTGLTVNTPYYIRVRAVLGDEISDYSNVVYTETTTSLPEPIDALKDKATTFKVGLAVSSNKLFGSYDTAIRREFNSLTAENEMKMKEIFISPATPFIPATSTTPAIPATASVYDFSKLDLLLDYAQTNNLSVHGHTLIWHNSVPDWMNTFSGTNAEFEDLVHNYITAVVTHCLGKVKSWDVVNEVISDGGSLRNTIFLEKMGINYVKKCFKWARESDPNALLFYNDYNTSIDQVKQKAVYKFIDDLLANNVPINGVGMQMHITVYNPTKAQLIQDTNEIVKRNLKVHYSELDIRVNADNILTNFLTPERNLEQKLKYKEVVKIYNAIPTANKYAITIWGLKDDNSWIIPLYGRTDYPLLFNADFSNKKAHTGFLEGLN